MYSLIDYAWKLSMEFLWGLFKVGWAIIQAILEARQQVKDTTYNGPEDQSHA